VTLSAIGGAWRRRVPSPRLRAFLSVAAAGVAVSVLFNLLAPLVPLVVPALAASGPRLQDGGLTIPNEALWVVAIGATGAAPFVAILAALAALAEWLMGPTKRVRSWFAVPGCGLSVLLASGGCLMAVGDWCDRDVCREYWHEEAASPDGRYVAHANVVDCCGATTCWSSPIVLRSGGPWFRTSTRLTGAVGYGRQTVLADPGRPIKVTFAWPDAGTLIVRHDGESELRFGAVGSAQGLTVVYQVVPEADLR
jgi:hypothetical protein